MIGIFRSLQSFCSADSGKFTISCMGSGISLAKLTSFELLAALLLSQVYYLLLYLLARIVC